MFSPGQDLGIEGDKIQLRFKPCCSQCLATVEDFRKAIHRVCIDIELPNGRRHPVYQIHSLTKNNLNIREQSGVFIFSIDYGDMLPHAPEADLFVTITLKVSGYCTRAIKLLSLPYGVDGIVRDFYGQNRLDIRGILDPSRLHLQTVECRA